MSKILVAFFCLLSFFGASQWDVVASEGDSFLLEPDYVPIEINGQLVWYDVMNQRASDSIRITDLVQPTSGYNSAFILKNDSLWGMLNGYGEVELPFAYDSIIKYNNFTLVLQNGNWSFRKPGYIFNDGPNQTDYLSTEEIEDKWVSISFDSIYFNGTELYLFDNEKTGMILENGTIIPTKYDGIQRLHSELWGRYSSFLLTLSGDYYNLLDEKGNKLLPEGVCDLRATEDGVCEFLRGDNPEYYIPYTRTFVKPNGRDIIFYRDLGYKIYSEHKSKSELYLSNGEVLKGTFDDYFLLGDGTFKVVRRGNKVGLSRDGKTVIGALKYDQVNLVSDYFVEGSRLFRYYHGDSCGLMNEAGSELFKAKYANILGTGHSDRFIVLDNELGGVVNRKGQLIIPIKYDHIYFDRQTKLFVVRKNDRIGLFDFNGEQITPIEYSRYSLLEDFPGDYLAVLKKSDLFFFVQKGKVLASEGFGHFNYHDGVLKAYGEETISVFLFDDKGKLEAREEYPHYKKAVVRSDRYLWEWEALGDWLYSELEENQQAGYFGLRYYTKRGFGVEPQYRTVILDGFVNYLAEVDDAPTKSHSIAEIVPTELVKGFHYLKTGSGKTDGQLIFNSEVVIIDYGSSDRFLHHYSDGTQYQVDSEGNVGISIDLTNEYLYSDQASIEDFWAINSEYRRYFIGDSVELCSIDSADISLQAYFNYWTATSTCRFSSQVMKTLMNPSLGVRFVNKKIGIINASIFGIRKDFLSYKTMNYFDEYHYILSDIFFEKPVDSRVGSLKSRIVANPRDKIFPIEDVLEATSAEGRFGDYIVATMKTDQLAKIHVDYPNYFFMQDTLNLSYNGGRVTRKVDLNLVVLVSPNGNRLTEPCLAIRYLNNECFGLLQKDGLKLVDKNGKFLSDSTFQTIEEFKDGRAQCTFASGSAIILNPKGEKLAPLPEPRISLDANHYYYKSDTRTIFHEPSGRSDQAQKGEKYLSGFFLAKSNGISMVRPFGSSETIKVKSDGALKSFGNQLYYVKGKHVYAIDSGLKISKFKKVDKLKLVTPEIAWLQGKKDVLIDKEWNTIHVLGENDRFELRDGDLIVFEDDSTFQNYGGFKKEEERLDEPVATTEVKLMKNGKYGAMLGDSIVLRAEYDWLSKINEREFFTKINSEKRLYDAILERIGDQPFDDYIETDYGNFVFSRNGQSFLVTEDRKRCMLITLE